MLSGGICQIFFVRIYIYESMSMILRGFSFNTMSNLFLHSNTPSPFYIPDESYLNLTLLDIEVGRIYFDIEITQYQDRSSLSRYRDRSIEVELSRYRDRVIQSIQFDRSINRPFRYRAPKNLTSISISSY